MSLNTATDEDGTVYWTTNDISGELIMLRQLLGGGLRADHAEKDRFGHQQTGLPTADATGSFSYKLGSKSTFVVLTSASIATLATQCTNFASSPTLASPIWLTDGAERTVIRQNDKAAVLGANATAQLEVKQGENSVFLTQQNCSDLSATLTSIGNT